MEQIAQQYSLLFDFLNKHFHENAYEEYPFADNAYQLIEEAVHLLLERSVHFSYLKELENEMYFFIHTPIEEEAKNKALQKVLKVELMDLKPLEFVRLLSYHITIEKWKKR